MKTQGIIQANVDLKFHNAKVKYDRTIIGPRQIIEKVEYIGFNATISDEENSKVENLVRQNAIKTIKWRNSFVFSAIFGFLSMVVMFLFMFILPTSMDSSEHSADHGDHLGHSNMTMLTTTAPSKNNDHTSMFVLLPGLNLETLLLFLLATPVQVNFKIKQIVRKIML